MSKDCSRRRFIKQSMAVSASAAMAFEFEEKALLAHAEESTAPADPNAAPGDSLPKGKIGNVEISRLICGGNLISTFAHSRDLIYVSSLLKQYFTDEKVMETFKLAETHGINTAILRLDERTLHILDLYWNQHGGKLQWIAQIKPTMSDLFTDADRAIDAGACGVYVQGETGDRFVEAGKEELLGKVVEHIKKRGVIGGIGAHSIEVPIACEKIGIDTDFYMKTFNAKKYWSAGPMPRKDSVWEETPEQTIEFFKTVKKPWIGFKVLGAGAIHPKEGFAYAFENGADFICVGMFDFQIKEDVEIAKTTLSWIFDRERPWQA